MSSIREDSSIEPRLTGSGAEFRRIAPHFLPPLAILAALAMYVHAHWQEIPIHYPIHWTTGGTPNGWATKSFASLYGPPLFGALIIVFLAGLCVWLVCRFGSPRSVPSSAAVTVTTATAYMISIVLSVSTVMSVHYISAKIIEPLVIAVLIAFFIVLGIVAFRILKHIAKPEAAGSAYER